LRNISIFCNQNNSVFEHKLIYFEIVSICAKKLPMQLEKISIKGFRGIPNLELPDLGRINLIVGKNNTSKTSVLEAIFLLIGASNPILVANVNNFRNLVLTDEDDLRFVFNNLDFENQLQIKGEFSERGLQRDLHIKPGKKVIYAESSNSNKNGVSFPNLNTATGEHLINELIFEFTNKEFQKKAQQFQGSFTLDNGNLTINPPHKYKEAIKGIYVLPSSYALSETLEKQLENLIVNKQEQKIVEGLRHIDSSIKGIALGANRMVYVDIGLSRLIPLNLLGDGIRRMLNIMLSISGVNNGIALIDEIDNGLHFSTLSVLWKTVLEASKQFNVQIFTTTHNYETLKYLKILLDQPEMHSFQSCVRSITLQRLNDQSIMAYTYTHDKLNYSIEQGIEIR